MVQIQKLSVVEAAVCDITRAIQTGSIEEFKYLVTINDDFNAILSHDQGSLPIHIASEFGRLDIIEYLLARGINVDKTDKDGWTPLQYAVKGGQLAVINRLIVEEKSNLNVVNINGDTLLHFACAKANQAVVDILLNALEKTPETKRILSIVGQCGNTPLHVACIRGNEEVVRLLLNALEKLPVSERNLAVVNEMGNTPLHFACGSENKVTVGLLLNALEKLPVSERNLTAVNAVGNTPLHFACGGEDKVIVSLLLNALEKLPVAERNLNKVGIFGNTALHIACYYENRAAVGLMLNALEKLPVKERFLNIANEVGCTPLHFVCASANKDVVGLFLKALEKIPETERNLDVADERGDTALHIACERWGEAVVALLLNAGARPGNKNLFGYTELYLYLRSAKFDLERLNFATLEKMSPYTDLNPQKMSLAHFVTGYSNFESLKIALRLQKNINVLDIKGYTPLNYVTNKLANDLEQRCNMIKLLIKEGAYFTARDSRIIDYDFRNALFTDYALCVQSFIDKLIKEAIPSLYDSPLSAHLPLRERLLSFLDYRRKLENCVNIEIRDRGYCDFGKLVSPLFYLSVVCLSNYYNTPKIISGCVKK